jgi:Aminotransferase class-V
LPSSKKLPPELDERYHLRDAIPAGERPVVFLGPYEHHSDELPWRESIADVVRIPEDESGHIWLAMLEKELIRYAERPLKIGSLSAASNVTGILTDTHALSQLLHQYGALSFWDYAAAAPYVPIEMRDKDAIFLSPHKFIGGPSTPGVLVVRRALLHNRVPTVPGGGTVEYVSPEEHSYVSDREHREEGGPPRLSTASAPGWSSSSRRPSARRSSRRTRRGSCARLSSRGAANQGWTCSETLRRNGFRSFLSGCWRRVDGIFTTISSWRCSTTSSGSRPAAGVPAPVLMATGSSA